MTVSEFVETATLKPHVCPDPESSSPIETSPETDKLYPALVAAIAKMPTIGRSTTADAGSFKTKYAELGTILDAVRPVLAAESLAVLQPVVDAPNGMPIVTTMVLHTSGQWLRTSFAVHTNPRDAWAVGSAITYARRYALSATLSIATADDDDGRAARDSPAPVEEFVPSAVELVKAIAAAPDDVKDAVKKFATGRKVTARYLSGDPVFRETLAAFFAGQMQAHDVRVQHDVTTAAGETVETVVEDGVVLGTITKTGQHPERDA